ncbi:calcium-activated chloride channel regulator 4-like [Cebus imitator]|uniref:calcium-activated chloride channel regulator 4-like n=1 Tax=Cebus imitator TaxID=2715852 RepID=UPI00189BC988|nr:calcium-activated chloride channel regulator 4-like [Cebus imitator]
MSNITDADSFKNDGVYSRYFTAYTENGRYSLKVRAHGGTNTARLSLRHPLNRAAYIPGWVVNGEIEANPPRPENNEDTQFTLENFSQTASGGAFVVSQVPSLPLPDLYLPSQITDLDATPHEDEIVLTWTAPGDDFDVGKAPPKDHASIFVPTLYNSVSSTEKEDLLTENCEKKDFY